MNLEPNYRNAEHDLVVEPKTVKTLNQRIASFYDESTPLWLNVWGDHMHHGYYGADGSEKKSHYEAQLDLMDELIDFAKLDAAKPKRILDAGCGVGGASRYLAGRFSESETTVTGLTLSPVQAVEGNRRAVNEGCDHLVTIKAEDMMQFSDEEGFDVIWSLESAEHVADKKGLLEHFYSLLRPGGTLAMITWCHRETPPELSAKEQALLQDVCRLYHLPPWCSIGDYVKHAEAIGFEQIASADWSAAVAPFWAAVIKSALSWKSAVGLFKAGPQTLKGAYAMRYMQRGFRQNLIRFGVFRMVKPS